MALEQKAPEGAEGGASAPAVRRDLESLRQEVDMLQGLSPVLAAGLLQWLTEEETQPDPPQETHPEAAPVPPAAATPESGQPPAPAEQPASPRRAPETPQKALMERLREARGEDAALLCERIWGNIRPALMARLAYDARITVDNFDEDGARTIQNNCVGFVMQALERLPIRIPAGVQEAVNRNLYLSEYRWGGRDAYRHFIPDVVGGDPSYYRTVDVLDPEKVDREQVGPHLATGEFAIGANSHHVFLIYKAEDGTIRMIHSSNGGVQENSFRSYVEYMQRTPWNGKPQPMYFRFLPVSEILRYDREHQNDPQLKAQLEAWKQQRGVAPVVA